MNDLNENTKQNDMSMPPTQLEFYALDPSPYVGAPWRSQVRNPVATEPLGVGDARAAWLCANGWHGSGKRWVHDLHGECGVKKALWIQIRRSHHERIALLAAREPRLPMPPMRYRRTSRLTRLQVEKTTAWLLLCGAKFEVRWPDYGPDWYIDTSGQPLSMVDYSLLGAAMEMTDRWLTQQCELLGWDWQGINGHPSRFCTPEGKSVTPGAALRRFFSPTVVG